MTAQSWTLGWARNGLDFRWVEIHAARDHYVAFAITEVEEVGALSLVQSS